MKIIAFGFMANGKSSYLSNPWNLLDFTIVLLSLLSLTPIADNLRVFKMFRILRVLRLIGRNDSLKVGMQALIYAIPNMFNVAVIMLFFFLIFGILFVSYFKGKLFKCINQHITLEILNPDTLSTVDIENKWDCLVCGGEWMNNAQTFDNIFAAMKSLFVMATAAAWADMMYLMASATDID